MKGRGQAGSALHVGGEKNNGDESAWLNAPQTAAEEAAIRRCIKEGRPYGTES